MSDQQQSYWQGGGKDQHLYRRITNRKRHSSVFNAAFGIYRDHYNNGSWNNYDSALEELREAKISKAKDYLAALDRIEQCFSDYREYENSGEGACPTCGNPHDEREWDPWQYSDAFETMMDFVLRHEAKRR